VAIGVTQPPRGRSAADHSADRRVGVAYPTRTEDGVPCTKVRAPRGSPLIGEPWCVDGSSFGIVVTARLVAIIEGTADRTVCVMADEAALAVFYFIVDGDPYCFVVVGSGLDC